jgi:hypothetical protein
VPIKQVLLQVAILCNNIPDLVRDRSPEVETKDRKEERDEQN